MVVATSRSPGVVLLLLAAALLLACTATGVAGDGSSTICDKAKCGRGTCTEVPGPIPLVTASYKCTCDPGWSQPKLLNLTVLDWVPCMIPNCSFDQSCYNFSFLLTPPPGIPLFDPCVAINCGSGHCKKGTGFMNYTCECDPGTFNFLNQTMLPCMKNCAFGDDCSKVGLGPEAPPPAPLSAAPPPGNQDSSAPKGSASSWRLLQQLLSLAILLLHQVV